MKGEMMDKTTMLQKLAEFKKRDQEIKAQMVMAKGQFEELNKEFTTWMQTTLGFEDREYHLAEMLSKAIETT